MNFLEFNNPLVFQRKVETLLRLAKLDNVLPKTSTARRDMLQRLQAVWETVQTQDMAIQEIQKLPDGIKNLYMLEFVQALPEVDVIKKVSRFRKDTQTLLVQPIRKSQRGNKGPTLLVHYERFSRDIVKKRSFVIKWTEKQEISCQRVYTALANGFKTVEVCALHTVDKMYETSDGKSAFCEVAKQLKADLIQIGQIYAGSVPVTKHIMIAERVTGENLFDFAKTRYSSLSESQKEIVFKELGKIAMLDLVLGNLDRLVQIFTNGDGAYCLMDLEANLGNVMISSGKGKPVVYAIDNGIENDLIDNEVMKGRYAQFLEMLFKADDWKAQVAGNIVSSIHAALRTQIDDVSEGNVIEIRRQMQDFADDVSPVGYSAILKGIEEMDQYLLKLLPSWVKSKEQSSHPELYTALCQRISLYLSVRSS